MNRVSISFLQSRCFSVFNYLKIRRSITKAGIFDAVWYVGQYPDVADSGINPIHHFVKYGFKEGRSPNFFMHPHWYNTVYRDVAISGINPILHFLKYGQMEGRDPGPNFRTKLYQETLRGLGIQEKSAIGHFLKSGRKMGLAPTGSFDSEIIRKSGLFDPEWYVSRYLDVKNSSDDPLNHFLNQGLWEDRQPNEYFDPVWYRHNNEDVAAAGAIPLIHYITNGIAEERMPSNKFSPMWYRSNYLQEIGSINPLHHYLSVGRGSGFLPLNPNWDWVYSAIFLKNKQEFSTYQDALRKHIEIMTIQPNFLIFIEGNDEPSRSSTIDSLNNQLYLKFRIVDAISDMTVGDYFIWLRAGDKLEVSALYEFANCINAEDPDLMYCDEDRLGIDMPTHPFFKPAWSPDLLECFNYIGRSGCYRINMNNDLWKGLNLFDFILSYTEQAERIVHLPKVLLHATKSILDIAQPLEIEADRVALERRLLRTDRTGVVVSPVIGINRHLVRLKFSDPPLVSVIIPTAGKSIVMDGKQINMLMNLLSLMKNSSYKNLEFIIIDNGDLGGNQVNKIRDMGCILTTYSENIFNISKKLNLGVSFANGKFLLLMNDDIEPLNTDWIWRMVEHFSKPHVGVVGAKLQYPDGMIQHAGVVTNHGSPYHVRQGYPASEDGYFFSTCADRNYLGVTGAVMMTPIDLYRKVGGYSEELAVSYNDFDYCLKLHELGLKAVYAAEASLVHFESKSRIPSLDPAEATYFAKRWAHLVSCDPMYNERQFDLAPPNFEIRLNPRII